MSTAADQENRTTSSPIQDQEARASEAPRYPTLLTVGGYAINKGTLLRMYTGMLPDCRCVVTDIVTFPDATKFEYMVFFIRGNGHVAASCGRVLSVDAEETVDLHSHSVWLDPSLRGLNVVGMLAGVEIRFLQNISTHERSRLSLAAGPMGNPNNPNQIQAVGNYSWAVRGYDFAHHHGITTQASEYPVRTKPDDEAELVDLEIQRTYFRKWLDARIADKSLAVSSALRQMIEEEIENLAHPWEFARYSVLGLEAKVEIGARKENCHLGKAYLLSGEAPYWCGVLFVNQPDALSTQVALEYDEACERTAVDSGGRQAYVDQFGTVPPADYGKAYRRLRADAFNGKLKCRRRYDAGVIAAELAPEFDERLHVELLQDARMEPWARSNIFSRMYQVLGLADVVVQMAHWVAANISPVEGDASVDIFISWSKFILDQKAARETRAREVSAGET